MRITERVHALKIPFRIPVGPGKSIDRFVYVYCVPGAEICLIDSGVKGADGAIAACLSNLGRRIADISLLVLTHAHPDHIGSARTIRDTAACIVAAHRDARAWIEDVDLQFRERPVPGFHGLVGGSTPVDRLLQDGELIDLGGISLEVLHTPGHAAGAISLYCREEKVLFAGDAIPQAGDLPIYDDAAATAASINRLRDLAGVEHLLASWTDPLAGSEVGRMMDDGLKYLQRIHEAIRVIAAGDGITEPMALCRRVVEDLGLPGIAVNPLTARSFASHLPVIDREKLV